MRFTKTEPKTLPIGPSPCSQLKAAEGQVVSQFGKLAAGGGDDNLTQKGGQMRKVGFAVIAYLVATASFAAVQSKPAAVYGTLRDSVGAPIPEEEILLVNKSTKSSSRTITNKDGEYRIEVPPGSYYMYVRHNPAAANLRFDLRVNENETIKKDLMLPERIPPVKRDPMQGRKEPLPEGAIPPPR